MGWFGEFLASSWGCVCCSTKRGSDFQFDREKFKLRMKKNGQELDQIIDSGIMHMFEAADFKETSKLDSSEVERLVAHITKEGFVFPVDIWAFDFNRSGFIEMNEFEACIRTSLHARKENMKLFFRASREACDQGLAAWLASGMLREWTMCKKDLALVLREFEDELGEPFMKDAGQCMCVYAKRHREELTLKDFQDLYNDYLCALYLMPKAADDDEALAAAIQQAG